MLTMEQVRLCLGLPHCRWNECYLGNVLYSMLEGWDYSTRRTVNFEL